MLDGYPFIFQMNDYSYSDNMLEFSVTDFETYVKRINTYVSDAMIASER